MELALNFVFLFYKHVKTYATAFEARGSQEKQGEAAEMGKRAKRAK